MIDTNPSICYQIKKFKRRQFSLVVGCGLLVSSCVSSSNQNNVNLVTKADISEAENFFHSTFTEEDKSLFFSLLDIRQSFNEILNSNFENSINSAKKILYTTGLTPEIYKYSLQAYSISKLILVDQSFSKLGKHDIEAKDYDFAHFQYDECDDLCDSIGWSLLVQSDPSIFTFEGNSKYILTKNILKYFNVYLKNINKNNIIYSENDDANEFTLNQNLLSYNFDNEDSLNELNIKKISALNLFVSGKFQDSIKSFLKLKEESKNLDFISMCYYWIGRNYVALNDVNSSKKYFNLSGYTNPLNLYDSLSGQMLKTQSGKVSTLMFSPFFDSWREEAKNWMKYPEVDIFNQLNVKDNFNLNIEFIKKSIKTCLLMLFIFQKENKFNSLFYMQDYFLNVKNEPWGFNYNFLIDNINWLKTIWPQNMSLCCSSSLGNYVSSSIDWLIYSTGNYLGASFFAHQVKDYINLSNDINSFLYFVFYPKPYSTEFSKISKQYEVDPDILYAIFRQYNLFYIKPTASNITTTAKNIKMLLKKYNNNLVYTIAAYKAGSDKVDSWLKNTTKFQDDVLFIEYIPDIITRNFVSEILRNYYNIKWIYSEKEPTPWWERMLFITSR